MAVTAVVRADGTVQPASSLTKPIKDRIRQARSHRRQFEPTWQSNLAFASGKHWLIHDKLTRTMRKISVVDPKYKGKDLKQFDLINEYRGTVLGELGSDDDRPELLLQRDDKASEEFQAQVNRGLGFAWDYEAQADNVLMEIDRLTIDLGTAAVRCRYDTTAGPVTPYDVPHEDGVPLLHPEEAQQKVIAAHLRGQQLEFKPINQGAIRLEALSAMNLLPPPGVTHEKNFPWECIVRPTLITDVQAQYGDAAKGLMEDKDIASSIGFHTTGTGQSGENSGETTYQVASDVRQSRLRDHVWLFTYYEKPSPGNPKGRVFVFAGNDYKLIHVEDKLPYIGPDGVYRSGLSYFHWWRVTGRFWSRALVEPMKDIQVAFNKRRMQTFEIIDRGQPAVFVERDSRARRRTDLAMELIELDKSERPPVVFPGVNPGEWMYRDMDELRNDLQHATGVRAPTMGENPQNVNTYSQLALLREADQVKRQPVVMERRLAIARMTEDMVYDMATYWGSEKQLRLAGDDHRMQAEVFNATRLRDMPFIVKTAKGSPKPRTQAAMLKMIEDIWNGAINAGQPLPLAWLKDSYEAAEPVQLPAQPSNDQNDKALLENHMLLKGEHCPVATYDDPSIHIPVHRSAQIQADLAHDVGMSQSIEAHIQDHLQVAQQNAQQVQQQIPQVQGAPPPVDPNQQAQLAMKQGQHQDQMSLKAQQLAQQQHQAEMQTAQRLLERHEMNRQLK